MFCRICRVLLAAFLSLTVLATAQTSTSAQSTHQVVDDMISRYVAMFNARDVEGILAMYGEDAKISQKTGLFSSKWIGLDEYRPHLVEKMAGYAEKGTTITGYEIKDVALDQSQSVAKVKLTIQVRQGIFHVPRSGRMDMRKAGEDAWVIVYDDF